MGTHPIFESDFDCLTDNMTFTFGAATANTTGGGGSLFGAKPAATATSSTGGGFSFGGGAATNTTAAPATGGGLFGNTSANTGGTSLFGNASKPATGGGLFGNASSAPTGGGGGLFGNSATNTNQAANQQPQNALLQCANACSQPNLFGDERDQLLAKFNVVQCAWGTGQLYCKDQAPISLSQLNPFSRFRTVGYSCLPTAKDADGLVWLECNKHVEKAQAEQAVKQALGNNNAITVVVEQCRKMGDGAKTEVTLYVKEAKPDGTTKRIGANLLYNGLKGQNIKSQLTTAIGLEDVIVRSAMTKDEIKRFTATAPAGIDPVIWKQANAENPDKEKMIPVPMRGFSALSLRVHLQTQTTEGHQHRNDIIQQEIRKIQDKQATTRSKIEERKRRVVELSRRVLSVILQQEIQRKSGLAIQTEEEQLRTQVEALNNQLRAPTQFRGRINELLSSIRMQYEGDMRPVSTQGGQLDPGALADIQDHLKNQQAGLSHMVDLMKKAFTDLEVIETGLGEAEGKPRLY